MASVLLEIGCEELPARACYEAEEQLPTLCRLQLGADPSQLFIGPRRLALIVDELPEQAGEEERRGPGEAIAFDESGQPTKAAEGFARSAGVDVGSLERREGYVWAKVAGEPLADVLPERVRRIVSGLTFGRSMRWNGDGLRFPRPVRWITVKLDGQTVEGMSGTTFGHRFTAGTVEIAGPSAYAAALRDAGVEPDASVRRRQIVEGLDELGGWSDPRNVLDEVVQLVEWVTVVEGCFDERYLQLPEGVVVTAMQSHQRYFPLGGNRFAFVANGGEREVVRAGNERVLESRLEDASFTFDRDVKTGIDGLLARLGSITLIEGAGTFADKAVRLVKLVEQLGGGEATVEAARLAKADQASELVREFPDLEGHIGAEYAGLAGYPEAVCKAIDEQYLPDSAGGPLPVTESGRVLSAADKIDNLTVSFGLGQRPTGSRDPFGLRRAAIGLCRLATEGGLTIPRALLVDDVADFVEERYEGLLDVPVEMVRAARRSRVAALGQVAELARAIAGLDEKVLDRLHTAYSRADRLAGRAEGAAADLDPGLLLEPAEVELARMLERVHAEIQARLQAADPAGALAAAVELAEPLDRFFEDVLVMAEDSAVRANRLRLLLDVRDILRLVADFSQISR
jgi:tetrameric-type glycyl-tRNA synthetase beta subunit